MPSSDFTRCAPSSIEVCFLSSYCTRATTIQTKDTLYSFAYFTPVTGDVYKCSGYRPAKSSKDAYVCRR